MTKLKCNHMHPEPNIHLFGYPSKEPTTLTDPQKPQNIGACPDLSEKQNKNKRFTCFQMPQEQILLLMVSTHFVPVLSTQPVGAQISLLGQQTGSGAIRSYHTLVH